MATPNGTAELVTDYPKAPAFFVDMHTRIIRKWVYNFIYID
jgi:hypothetical protein